MACPDWGTLPEEVEEEEEDDDDELDPLPKWIEGDSFAPFVGTPGEFLDTVLGLAGITEEDVVCDIGSGDGRIPIMAVQKFNARRAIGIEIEEDLVQRARAHAKRRGVAGRVEFFHRDASEFEPTEHGVTVLTVYLLPDSFPLLKDLFMKYLKAGGRRRLITISWPLQKELTPAAVAEAGAENTATSTSVYLYDASSFASTSALEK